MLTAVHSNTGFPGVEDPCDPWWAYPMGGQVFRWSQSALYSTVWAL